MKNKISYLIVSLALVSLVCAMPFNELHEFIQTAGYDFYTSDEPILTQEEWNNLIEFYYSVPQGTTEVTLPPEIQVIYNNFYDSCTPDCTGKQCGESDGCDGFCTACPEGKSCQNGECKSIPTEQGCSSCGGSLLDLNRCDEQECLDLGDCEFIPGDFMNDCVTKQINTCIFPFTLPCKLPDADTNIDEQINNCDFPFILPCILN